GFHMDIGRRGARGTRKAAHRMPGGFQSKLARRSEIEDPACQQAILDKRNRPCSYAFRIEWTRGEAASTMWIVENFDSLGQDLGLQRAAQEARAARDGRAHDGGKKMTEKAGGDAAVIDDRDSLRFDFPCAKAPCRAQARLAPDVFGLAKILRVGDGR